MNLGNQLYKRFGNPLEWNSARKANVLLWIYFLQQGIYFLWLWGVPAVAEFQMYFDPQQVAHYFPYVGGLLGFSLVVLAALKLVQLRWPDGYLYEHFAAQYFSLTHIFYGYTIGLMSLPVGVVMAGAPVVGFIFFHRSAVALAFINSIVIILVVSYLSTQEVFGYAPIAANLYQSNGQLSMFWLAAYCSLAAPHLFFMFGLAGYVLQRWRVREEEVNRLSRTDALTDLMNRRCILDYLERVKRHSEKNKLPLSVLMVDLDYFKQINDRWGHDVGDQALIAAAKALKESIRINDFAGRYGGEEFLVLLPGLNETQAHPLAERIRMAIGAVRIQCDNQVEVALSASIGMSGYSHKSKTTTSELIKQADNALYQAKHTGRNRLVVAAGAEN
ncbi:GGDEF domain-containing protein [Ketobacter sp. MCCC 1A13808]|uniref:GGDEF domain-containing protein n=1 Tax=Ketobacter sp. MCCC 1A13808 TaxID=2602738 RepID=UPI0012EBF9AE|nr:GGDEF domain-containing protein [Ketobacter sp. MCCC 1A13808]MVF11727.1 GGDEF domain-containing protein [Ketobacter sp. MCCC 1A13808]